MDFISKIEKYKYITGHYGVGDAGFEWFLLFLGQFNHNSGCRFILRSLIL